MCICRRCYRKKVMKHISKKSKRKNRNKKFLSRSTICVLTAAAMLSAVCIPAFAQTDEAEPTEPKVETTASADTSVSEEEVQPSEVTEPSDSPEPGETAEPSESQEPSDSDEPAESAEPTKTPSPSKEVGNNAGSISDEDLEQENPPVEDGEEGDGVDWEAIPSWVGSADSYMTANLALMLEVKELDDALEEQIEVVREAFGMSKDAKVVYGDDNIADVIAIYALLGDMTDSYPNKVEIADDEAKEALRAIYWMMTSVSGSVTENEDGTKTEEIRVARLTYDDVKDLLDLSDAQVKQLKKLTTDDAKTALQKSLTGTILGTLSKSELNKIAETLRGLDPDRQAVIAAGLSLVGKVPYFWGGKSYTIGWDSRWGSYSQVTSEGSTTTGKMRAYGLDCSGFVSWAFINAAGDKSMLKYVGSGTANQWRCSKAVSWSEAQPGDLVFYRSPNGSGTNHVGILVCKEGGSWKVVHCSSSRNCVVLTGLENFKYVRRPYIYDEI